MITRSTDGGPLTYTCHTCGKTMTDKSKIKRHAEVHLNMSHPLHRLSENVQDEELAVSALLAGSQARGRLSLGHHVELCTRSLMFVSTNQSLN